MTINTYSVVQDSHGYYIQARISGARRFCGDGPAGKTIAEDMCKKWNAASEKYKEAKVHADA